MSRQPEHYLLKSQATRPSDVLHREESDNTGRRVLSLSPVGASLFNARWLAVLCENAFHSRESAQLVLFRAVERIFKRTVINVMRKRSKYGIMTHAKELLSDNNGKYLFVYARTFLIRVLVLFLFLFFFDLSYILLHFLLLCIHKDESADLNDLFIP